MVPLPNSHTDIISSGLDFEFPLEHDSVKISPTKMARRETEATVLVDYSTDGSMTFDDSDSNTCCSASTSKEQDTISSSRHSQCFDLMSSIFETNEKQVTEERVSSSVDDATAITTETSDSSETVSKRVRFGSLQIHEHALQLGGSGVPGAGPAVSLGWEQQGSTTISSVIEYEEARPCVPRKGSEMLQPKMQRVDMLLESGYSLNQIRICTQEFETIRKQRNKTNQSSLSEKAKSTLKSVFKKNRKSSNR
mmetsp:Transcript_10021/g.21064  ORF Transcript_10021/g.21064 Transcript_10021/m.21064 type:complete len:251 (+) Transcript_10021:108-860(+)